jgi:hypothetical protein
MYLNWKANIRFVCPFALRMSHCLRCALVADKNLVISSKFSYLPHVIKSNLLTYSMEQSPSQEANRFSASQEILHILWNPKFIIAFTSVRRLPLS